MDLSELSRQHQATLEARRKLTDHVAEHNLVSLDDLIELADAEVKASYDALEIAWLNATLAL